MDEAARAWIHSPHPQPRAHDRRSSFTVRDWRPWPSPLHLRWVSSPRGWPVLGLQLEPLSGVWPGPGTWAPSRDRTRIRGPAQPGLCWGISRWALCPGSGARLLLRLQLQLPREGGGGCNGVLALYPSRSPPNSLSATSAVVSLSPAAEPPEHRGILARARGLSWWCVLVEGSRPRGLSWWFVWWGVQGPRAELVVCLVRGPGPED